MSPDANSTETRTAHYYYTLIDENSFYTIDSYKSTKASILYNYFLKDLNKPVPLNHDNHNSIIHLYNVEAGFAFGTFGSLLDSDPLVQLRDLHSNETKIPTEDETPEQFIYFYIDFNTQNILAFNKKGVSSIDKFFNIYLKKEFPRGITVKKRSINNLNEYISRLRRIQSINIDFYNPDAAKEQVTKIEGLDDFGANEIEKVSLALKISQSSPISDLKNKIIRLMGRQNFSKLVLHADSDEFENETINLLSSYLTRKIQVPVSNQELLNNPENRNAIMEKMREMVNKEI